MYCYFIYILLVQYIRFKIATTAKKVLSGFLTKANTLVNHAAFMHPSSLFSVHCRRLILFTSAAYVSLINHEFNSSGATSKIPPVIKRFCKSLLLNDKRAYVYLIGNRPPKPIAVHYAVRFCVELLTMHFTIHAVPLVFPPAERGFAVQSISVHGTLIFNNWNIYVISSDCL